ncbi:hypothetical protein ACF0H5_013272 [Mactra antiquata]
MSDILPGMDERYRSPKRIPRASESDSMLYTSGYQNVTPSRPQQNSQAEQIKKLSGMGLVWGSVCGFEIISHPFIVMRRSCQIMYPSRSSHLTPISIVPLMMKINSNKPPVAMYKGFVSSLLCRGFNMITENIINEFTNWPVEVSSYSTLKKHCLHLALKCSGFIITAPFFVSCFVETVQSHGANEPPALYEFILEGCNRLVGRCGHQSTWIIPIWKLLIPTALFRLSQYCIYSLTSYAVIRATTEKQLEQSDNSSPVDSNVSSVSFYNQQFPLLLGSFAGTFVSDLLLFPLETVLHRLYIQGTRVLIDNTDTGHGVCCISTQYSGVIDCIRSVISEEGIIGLYHGFGAFLLQFSIHFIGLKMVQYLFDKISKLEYTNGSNGNGHRPSPYRRDL